jgi:hypothetical protein
MVRRIGHKAPPCDFFWLISSQLEMGRAVRTRCGYLGKARAGSNLRYMFGGSEVLSAVGRENDSRHLLPRVRLLCRT